MKGGGGSGDVTVDYVVNLYDGLKSLGGHVSLCEELADFYRKDVKRQYDGAKQAKRSFLCPLFYNN